MADWAKRHVATLAESLRAQACLSAATIPIEQCSSYSTTHHYAIDTTSEIWINPVGRLPFTGASFGALTILHGRREAGEASGFCNSDFEWPH